MPEAHVILWFLGAFLGLWGLTLLFRGLVGERVKAVWACPSCRAMLSTGSLACGACGYESRSERAVRARRRNWFLSAAGLVAVVLAAGTMYAGAWVYTWSHVDPDIDPPELPLEVSPWGALATGTAVLSVALMAWAIRGDRSRGRRRCPRCWYDMSAAPSLRCSECGRVARNARHLYRVRRRWRLAALALLGLVLAGGMVEWPRYQKGGVPALLPTTVLITGLNWLPDSFVLEHEGADEDWTLRGRVRQDSLWGWQSSWLEGRAAATIRRGRDVRSVSRAMEFTEWGPGFAEPVLLAAARGLCSREKEEQHLAVDLVIAVSGHLAPNGAAETKAALSRTVVEEVPGLSQLLDGPDTYVALAGAEILGWQESEIGWIAPRLAARAHKTSAFGLFGLGISLSGYIERTAGSAGREEIDACFSSPRPEVRRFALIALGKRVALEPALVNVYTRLLADPDASVARIASRYLTRELGLQGLTSVLDAARRRADLGTGGADLLPSTHLTHESVAMVMPELLRHLMHSDPELRSGAMIFLADSAYFAGVNITPAVPQLIALQSSPISEESDTAKRAVEYWLAWLTGSATTR